MRSPGPDASPDHRGLRGTPTVSYAEGATGPWSGTVVIRPRVGQIAKSADRLLSDLDAGRVTRAALLATMDMTAKWLHRVFAHDCLSVVVLEDFRRSIQPRGVTDRTAHGGMGLFVFGAPQPAQAFFDAVGSWGHVLVPWRQVRPAPIAARVTQGAQQLWDVSIKTGKKLVRNF